MRRGTAKDLYRRHRRFIRRGPRVVRLTGAVRLAHAPERLFIPPGARVWEGDRDVSSEFPRALAEKFLRGRPFFAELFWLNGWGRPFACGPKGRRRVAKRLDYIKAEVRG